MLRLKPIVAFWLCFAMVLSFGGCKKEDPSVDKTSMTIADVDDAITQLAEAEADYGYENALSELTEKSASTIDGDSYYRLQQNYQGIPVYGRTIICATDKDGTVTSITGNTIDVDAGVSLAPTITLEQATLSIGNYISENLGYDGNNLKIDSLESDSLCIFIADGSYNSRLAYCMNIGDLEIVIDANNSDVLYASRTVYEEAATGYTASDTNRNSGFSIEKLGEYYYVMSDTSRGLSVFTFAGQISQDNTGFHRDRATIVESTDEVFGNTEAEIALEYEKGAKLLLSVSAIQDCFSSLGFSSFATDTNLYYNDGYDNGENALGGKVDGYGVISMGSSTGVSCVDVIAHEYTHFVSRELVGWTGNAENGALNEAMSDIFGEIIESYVTGSDINWVMDEFRNIAEPSAYKHPDFYKGDNWGDTSNPTKDNDYGYVHNNSTVISHTAYLMWNGIDGTDSKRIGTDDLAELWYRSMLMMPSDCNFSDCRQIVELAATSMELTTTQIECVSEAFNAVGITKSSKETFVALYDLALDSTLSVYGGDGELYDNYTLNITGNTTIYGPVTEKVDSSYSRTRTISSAEPYELNLPQGIYVFTITDNANPSATSTFTVCVQNNEGDANIDIFTNFGCTPVKGTVSEIKDINGVETNVPITNATVKVYSHAQESVVETIDMSETEGFFEVYLPIGNYSFAVEAEGYISSTVSFEVTAAHSEYLEIILKPDTDKSSIDTFKSFADVIESVQSNINYTGYSASQIEYCRGDFFEVDGKNALVLMYHVWNGAELTPGYYVGLWVENSDGTISCLTDQLIEEVGDPDDAYVTVNIRKIDGKMYLNPYVRKANGNTDISKNQYYLIGDEPLLEYNLYSEGNNYYLNQEQIDQSTFYSTQDKLNIRTYILGLDPNWSEGLPPQGYTFEELLEQLPAGTTSNDSGTNNSLTTELGLSADSAQAIVDVYVPFCQSLSDTYTSSDGSVANQRSCLVVEFETGSPNLVVHYWVPNAYDPGQFCEAWIIYGIESGEVVELYSDENYAPTRREIDMVYDDTYGFALREEQTGGYYELIIHYPDNVTDTSMYENYNYIQLSEDGHTLRVWTISGDYVDISF